MRRFDLKTQRMRSRHSWRSASPTSRTPPNLQRPHNRELKIAMDTITTISNYTASPNSLIGPALPERAEANLDSLRNTMDKPMNVCVLVGSLRKASFNGMLANALISLAPSSMELDIVEMGNCPSTIRISRSTLRRRDEPHFASTSRLPTRRCSSRRNTTLGAGCPQKCTGCRLQMESASLTASLVPLSAAHRARSGPSAPIII